MPDVETYSGGNPIVAQLYAATSPSELQSLYNAWAKQYNQDLSEQDYQAPTCVAEAVLQHVPSPETVHSALDAGCGTGLSGIALKTVLPNLKVLDGIDLSTGMLDQARQTGLYTTLTPTDLTRPLTQLADNTYDVVICVGTLTHGHVGPSPALGEFVRLVKCGGKGILAATVLEDLWESGGFRREVERLETEGGVKVLGVERRAYRVKAGVSARVIVLRKV